MSTKKVTAGATKAPPSIRRVFEGIVQYPTAEFFSAVFDGLTEVEKHLDEAEREEVRRCEEFRRTQPPRSIEDSIASARAMWGDSGNLD